MFAKHDVTVSKVGNAARHAQDALVRARRQAQTLGSTVEQHAIGGRQRGITRKLLRAELRIGHSGTRLLALPCLQHALAHGS